MNATEEINDISNRVTKMRVQSGWKQQELAERAEITQGALSQIDNGKRIPTLLVLPKVSCN